MNRRVKPISVAVVLTCFSLSMRAVPAEQTGARETVLDGTVHITDELVLDIPKAPMLCDAPGIRKQNVDIGDCALCCEEEGAGTPMVLLHGGPGATHHYFHPYFSRAAEWARIVYYDQRGCGQSEYKAGKGYSVDQAVDDLDALREALGIQRWVVLGHSYGGTVAQCYAVKYPDRVLGLVLVGSACFGLPANPSGTRQYDFITKEEQKRIGEIRANGSLSMEQLVFNSHLNGDWKRQSFYRPSVERVAQMALYEWKHDKLFRGQVSQSLDKVDLENAFDDYPAPILIMEGRWDLTWSADKPSRFQECFPGSTLIVFDRAGHSPFEDVPETFFPMLKAFVGGLQEPSEDAIRGWRERRAVPEREKAESPERFVRGLGWGRESSKKLAEKYSEQWLEQVNDTSLLMRIGFALYDVGDYERALAVFKKMAENPRSGELYSAVALVWQGQTLDLLGRREEAISVYKKVADMGVQGGMQHDQYGLAYSPSAYAAERMEKPFTRLENRDND